MKQEPTETDISKLKKLYALAIRGEGGEADNARAIMNRMLAKFGMSIEEILDQPDYDEAREEEQVFVIPAAIPNAFKVLAQLIFSFGLRPEEQLRYSIDEANDTEHEAWVHITPAEYALTAAFWPACCRALKDSWVAMKYRHQAEMERARGIRARHRQERRDLALVFINQNDLFDKNAAPPKKTSRRKPKPLQGNPNDITTFDHDHESKLPDHIGMLTNR